MSNQINFSLIKDKTIASQVIKNQNELEKIKLERGWIGGIWGNSEQIPNNIAALTIILLMLAGFLYTYSVISLPVEKIPLSIKDFLGIIAPLFTLAIGYLFGEKNKKNKD